MNKLQLFIRKNLVFLLLLNILIIVIVFFTYQMLIENSSKHDVKPPVIDMNPNIDVEEPKITWLSGDYRRNDQILIMWATNIAVDQIKSINLFYGNQQLGGEMKHLTSYMLDEKLYQFPTGKNTFELVVTLINGKQLKEVVEVEISPVVNIQMETETKDQTFYVHLSYMYNSGEPVKIPHIIIPNSTTYNWQVFYDTTIRKQGTPLDTAITTYKISLANVSEGTHSLTLRWFFEGLNISEDFTVSLVK